jgi:glucose-1-phosphate thymidylyltransferase
VDAILLCAGFGTRLGSLARETAKPLLPVAGKPIVEYLVEQLAATGRVTDLWVVSNRRFAPQFQAWRDGVAPRLPDLRIEVADDGATSNENRLGAVRDLAWAVERARPQGPTLVSAGDNLVDFDIGEMLDDHAENPRHLVLAYREMDSAKLQRTGVAKLDADRRIVGFTEKPSEPASEWACPAFYILQPDALALIPDFLEDQPEADAPGGWIAWLARRQPVFAHKMRGRRLSIGDPDSYRAAEAWITQPGSRLRPREATSDGD